MKELLTAEEVADRLKVRPATVKAWGQKGLIPVIRLTPKVVRYDLDAVVAALASHGTDRHPEAAPRSTGRHPRRDGTVNAN